MHTIKELDNGIKVLMHKIPYIKSSTLGIIINNGSIYENPNNNGISHFIEHMLFKGTRKRTSREIAETMDDIGGQINAFTSKEHTCFYGKVIDEHLPIAVDVLGDMINNSLFEEQEIEKEKGVVIEEINMYKDFPEDLVFELLTEITYKNLTLAYPVLGTENTVNNFTKRIISSYYKTMYTPNQIVISLVGSFNEIAAFDLLNKHFGSFNQGSSNNRNELSSEYKTNKTVQGIYKDIEQLNFTIGFQGPSTYSDDLFPMMIVNNVLAGTNSSKLFQEIRENHGLVYTVESFLSTFNNTGMLSIYAGLNSNNILETTKLIKKGIDDLRINSLTPRELEKSKEHLKGSYILSLEGTFNKMYEMGKNTLHNKPIDSSEIVLKKINDISLDSVTRVIKKYLDWDQMNFAYVGPIKNISEMNYSLQNVFYQ